MIYVNLKTRTDKRTADRLSRLARREGRSVAEEMRRAIESHLARFAPDDAPKGRQQ